MKKRRFTESQLMQILKQAEGGVSVADLCREYEMSNASFYKWRSKCHKRWVFGLCFLYLRKVKGLGGITNVCIVFTVIWN